MNQIKKAAAIVGSASELARRVNVSRQTVHNWLNGGGVAPQYVEAVEAATDGLVTRHDLRPDLSRIFRE